MNFSVLFNLQTLLVAGISEILTINSADTFKHIIYFTENTSDLANAVLQRLSQRYLVTIAIQLDRNMDEIERFLPPLPMANASSNPTGLPMGFAGVSHTTKVPKSRRTYFEQKMHVILVEQLKLSRIKNLQNERLQFFDEKHLMLLVLVDGTMEATSAYDQQKAVAQVLLERLWTSLKFSQVAVARGRARQYLDIFTRDPYERRLRCETWTFVDGVRQSTTAESSDIYRRDEKTLNMHRTQLTVKLFINYFSIYNVSTRAGSLLGERFSMGGMNVNNCKVLAERLNASLRFVVPVLHAIYERKFNVNYKKLLMNMAAPVPLYDDHFTWHWAGTDIEYVYNMSEYVRYVDIRGCVKVVKNNFHLSVSEPYDLVGVSSALFADKCHGCNSMYPFEVGSFVAVVPNRFHPSSGYQVNINFPVQCWVACVWLLALFRKFVRKRKLQSIGQRQTTLNGIVTLAVDNSGIMLGTSMGIRAYGNADRIVRTAMSFSATFSGMFIATIIYMSYYNEAASQPLIDTVDDLFQSDLNICIDQNSSYLFRKGTRLQRKFGSIRSDRIKRMTLAELLSDAVVSNQTCAYLLPDTLGKILTIPSMWSNDHQAATEQPPTFRIMKETIGN